MVHSHKIPAVRLTEHVQQVFVHDIAEKQIFRSKGLTSRTEVEPIEFCIRKSFSFEI